MKARGKREARRPWSNTPNAAQGPERPEYVLRPFSGLLQIFVSLPGATRFALAPGYYIPHFGAEFTGMVQIDFRN